jgi:transcriptional regulator with XRE-family HTH domain
METERFPGRLAELRTAAGLTQQQLADKAGLHRVQIARLETGRQGPSWETVLAICTVLGVSCEEFRTAPADTPKKSAGRPRKAAADAGGANFEKPAPKPVETTAGQAKGRTRRGKKA